MPQNFDSQNISPDSADVMALLAQADDLFESGAFMQAGAIYREALNLDHNNVDALMGWASVAYALGNYDNAEKLSSLVLLHDETQEEAYFLRGKALAAQKLFAEARDCFEEALAFTKDVSRSYYNMAMTYFEEADYYQAAAAAVRGLRRVHDKNAKAPLYALLARASVFRFQRRKAISYYKRALMDLTDRQLIYDAHRELASLYMDYGAKKEALDHARAALALKPECVIMNCIVSQLVAHDHEDEIIQKLKDLLQSGALSTEDKARLNFALGRAHDDIGDIESAFSYYDAGNALVRSEYSYDIASVITAFTDIKRSYGNPNFIERARPVKNGEVTPIFIVGMPRSGTSLVEQILTSHPDVGGAGELVVMDELYAHEKLNAMAAYDYNAAHIPADTLNRVAAQYLSLLQQRVSGFDYVTDKMPMNFRYIGLIRMLFPQAKIIHCVRDPMDCGLSIYQHRFVGAFPFAYNLTELGQYIKLYNDLMMFWHEKIPGFVLDMKYEDLVGAQEQNTRILLDFCDLSWDAKCLDFHKNDRAVLTASALQVKKKMYSSSIGKADKYKDYLQPLKKALL